MEAFSFLNELNALKGFRAGWIERVAGLRIEGDRDAAMKQLRPSHRRQVDDFAGSDCRWWRAEQVHGNAVAVIPSQQERIAPDGMPVVPGVDGLITNQPGQLLSIYVADCGAIWLADPRNQAIGLLHSGKKGTAMGILQRAVDAMSEHFGTEPDDLVCVLSPCIRPPQYEIDFAADIARQAEASGIGQFTDCGLNTADDLERFYSYRMEQGKTGRMMAMLMRE